MQKVSLDSSKRKTGQIIAGLVLSCFLIFDVYLFFTETAIAAKFLAGGSFVLLLILVIPFWIKIFKNFKQGNSFQI